jgi:hypothetical protein
VAPSVSTTSSTSRSTSITAPAATASTSATVVVETTAQHLADQSRQDHGVGVDLTEQARREQPLHRAVGRCAGRGVAGSAHRRAFEQLVQEVALSLVGLGQPVGDLCRGLLGLRDRLAGIPGQARDRLGDDPHRGVAPHQRSLAQIVDGGGDGLLARPAIDQFEQLGERDRAGVGMEHEQRVEHREPKEIELVGRGLDGLARLRAGGQRRDGARRRLGEVGPRLQQPDQPLVVKLGQPGAQRDAWSVVSHC